MKLLKAPQELYIQPEFRSVRAELMLRRRNAKGLLLCSECGKPIMQKYECIAHHIQPVTERNMNDITVTLNPDNISLICLDCHNKEHNRFGYSSERKVYYVYGAPCSGKTSFVNAHKGNSDLIIDKDNIWQCITGGERYYKPDALRRVMFETNKLLLDMVKRRVGGWESAYIIEGGARIREREDKILVFGAEPIFVDTDKETCLRRLAADESRAGVQDEWRKYIDQWFETYQE